MPGLYFVVQPGSSKSWAIRYRLDGRTRKHPLGAYPVFDLKAARELAAKALRAVAERPTPGARRVRRGAPRPTPSRRWRQFVERYCLRANRARTADGDATAVRAVCAAALAAAGWCKDIRRRDVLDLLDGVVAGGRPVAANGS